MYDQFKEGNSVSATMVCLLVCPSLPRRDLETGSMMATPTAARGKLLCLCPPGFGRLLISSVKRDGSYPTAKATHETKPARRRYWPAFMSLKGSPAAR